MCGRKCYVARRLGNLDTLLPVHPCTMKSVTTHLASCACRGNLHMDTDLEGPKYDLYIAGP